LCTKPCQAEVSKTEKLLGNERATNQALKSESSKLAGELASTRNQLVAAAGELETARSSAAALQEQLASMKKEYIISGGWRGGGGERRKDAGLGQLDASICVNGGRASH
jgi:septal ring factor EnvC (AmiA/AmiB activator)